MNKFYNLLEAPAAHLSNVVDEAIKSGKPTFKSSLGVLFALGVAAVAIIEREGGSFDAADEAELAAAMVQHYNEKFTKFDLPGPDVIGDTIITGTVLPAIAMGVGYVANWMPKLAVMLETSAPGASGSAP